MENGVGVGASAELSTAMDGVREQQRRLAEFVAGHPWITGSGNRYAAWKTVDQAAKVAG